MRRSFWFRALIGIWGLWFTAALSEVGGIYTCAVHDGHAASVASHTAGHGQMAASMQHAQNVGGNASDSPSPSEHQHGGGACTCLGMCCCGAPVPTPSSTIAIVDVALVEVHPPVYRAVASPNVDRPYARPFANGPPARA